MDVFLNAVFQKSSGSVFADMYSGFPVGQSGSTRELLVQAGFSLEF